MSEERLLLTRVTNTRWLALNHVDVDGIIKKKKRIPTEKKTKYARIWARYVNDFEHREKQLN